MIWKGEAKPLPPDAFEEVSERLRIPAPVVQGVWRVESAGREYRRDLSLERRLEPHHLPDELQDLVGFDVPPGVPAWRASLAIGFSERERMFNRAVAEDQEATLDASSWGGPQILGSNAEACGRPSATEMVREMADSAVSQLDCFERFITSKGLVTHLRSGDFLSFATGYNGPGQPHVYAERFKVEIERSTGVPIRPVLRMGDQGHWVTRLQNALGEIEADGFFGKVTYAAVLAFQTMADLTVDGVVGAMTWDALMGAPEPIKVEPEIPKYPGLIPITLWAEDHGLPADVARAQILDRLTNLPDH